MNIRIQLAIFLCLDYWMDICISEILLTENLAKQIILTIIQKKSKLMWMIDSLISRNPLKTCQMLKIK